MLVLRKNRVVTFGERRHGSSKWPQRATRSHPYSGDAELIVTGSDTDSLAAPPPDTVAWTGRLGGRPDATSTRIVTIQRVAGSDHRVVVQLGVGDSGALHTARASVASSPTRGERILVIVVAVIAVSRQPGRHGNAELVDRCLPSVAPPPTLVAASTSGYRRCDRPVRGLGLETEMISTPGRWFRLRGGGADSEDTQQSNHMKLWRKSFRWALSLTLLLEGFFAFVFFTHLFSLDKAVLALNRLCCGFCWWGRRCFFGVGLPRPEERRAGGGREGRGTLGGPWQTEPSQGTAVAGGLSGGWGTRASYRHTRRPCRQGPSLPRLRRRRRRPFSPRRKV